MVKVNQPILNDNILKVNKLVGSSSTRNNPVSDAIINKTINFGHTSFENKTPIKFDDARENDF